MVTIFFDVDTQNDFMNKKGSLYVHNAEFLKPNLEILTQYAINNGISIFGSVDTHTGLEPEMSAHGGPFPNHCMIGTYGQKKIKETLGNGPVFIPCHTEIPVSEYGKYEEMKHVIFEKDTYDVKSNINFMKMMDFILPEEAIVYGVATDYCIKAAVLALRELDINCIVVKDAISGVDKETTASAIEEMEDVGAIFATLGELKLDGLKRE